VRVSVRNLSLKFHNGEQTIHDVNFEVSSGEFVALVGPSGCGKSTTLNVIASLISEVDAHTTGCIEVDGEDIRTHKTWKRDLGYVFQRDTLLPWRTISNNVEAGLEIRRWAKDERVERVRELMDLVGLAGFEDYFPHQLSGGMRQRASLIRTLAYDPQLILMDEPFGALDAQTRMTLQEELIRIWSTKRKTILFVTHDLAEAATLADRIILFSKRPGTIRRIATVPFSHPRDPFALHGTREFADFQIDLWKTERGEFKP